MDAIDTPKKRGRPFAPGNPGKPKGAVAKTPPLVREMIVEALNRLGGVEYLMECANDPKARSAFLTLIGKTIPLQVTGENGGPVQVTRIELVPMKGGDDA